MLTAFNQSTYIEKMKQDAIDSMGDYQRFWASEVDAKEKQVEEEVSLLCRRHQSFDMYYTGNGNS